MNKYKCFFNGKETIIESDTSYHAQLEAQKFFNTKKGYLISVWLVEKDGEPYTHSTGEIE